nr:hypothetical protein CFP56_07194 [Quercus suber]
MFGASSEQLCVWKGTGNDEVFPSGRNDLGTSSDERNPSTTLPSTRDEDLEPDRSKGDSIEGLVSAEPPTQSVIGQIQSVKGGARQSEDVQIVEEKDQENPPIQQ